MSGAVRVNDALSGGVLLVLALAVALHARGFPAIPGQQFGAAVFPVAIATALGLLALVLIARGARRWRGAVAWSDWARSRHGPLNLLLAVGCLLGYVLVAGRLGFIPTMAAILTVLFLALGTRWWLSVPVAALVTLLIHVLFVDLLKVPLPWGIVPPMAW